MADEVRVRRVYDDPAADDGRRILVDRVWPRGVRKDDLALDDWAKDVAPSTELRTWYHHDPDRLAEFTERYRAELAHNEALARLRDRPGTLTLLTATKDLTLSHATILRDLLSE